MGAPKVKDYDRLFKKDSLAAEVDKLKEKLIQELQDPEKAKKAALYIEQLINNK
jgi:hypothetical protein